MASFPVIGHVFDYVTEGPRGQAPIETALVEARQSGRPIVHYVDGLDEVDSELADSFIVNFVETLPAGEYIWVACRSENFFHQLSMTARHSTLYREVLEIEPWSPVEARSFVALYANRLGQAQLVDDFDRLLMRSPDAMAFVRNPFQLTLLLYLLLQDGDLQGGIRNSYDLYDKFYNHWLRRESHRGTSTAGSDTVCAVHTRLAESLFDARRSYGMRGLSLDPQIKSMLNNDTAFADLLRVDRVLNRVIGFRHETIAEYLLAAKVLSALGDPQSRLTDVLLRTFTFETNRFVREGIQMLDRRDQEGLVRLLSRRYNEYLGELPFQAQTDPNSPRRVDPFLLVREQLLYYIGRIPCASCPEVLRQAFDLEAHPLLKRIAALGATLHGDEEIERRYLDLLTPGSSWDVENRSIQLVYFGDSREDFYAFRDDGHHPWQRTRTAIAERIRGTSVRDERLRWWDLRTLRLFLKSREDRMSADEYQAVAAAQEELRVSSHARVHSIQEEVRLLIAAHSGGISYE